MYYHHLSIQGFGSHANKVSYDFSSGILFITGKNGSGKSTIFDAIQWCLFGPLGSLRTLKDRTSVVNTEVNSATVQLSVSHEILGDVRIMRRLTRAGKHSLEVVVNGVSQGKKIRENQEFISRMCGNMRHDIFSSVYMLMSSPLQPPSSFLGATPSGRRDILSRVVDPEEKFASAHKAISKKLTEEKKNLVSLESRIHTLIEMRNSLVEPEAPEYPSSYWDELITHAQKSHREDISQLIMSQKIAQENLEKSQKSYRDNEESKKVKEQEISKLKKNARRKKNVINNLSYDVSIVEAQVEVSRFITREYDRQMDNVTSLIDNKNNSLQSFRAMMNIIDENNVSSICPLCGSSMEENAQALSHQHYDEEKKELEELLSFKESLKKDKRKVLFYASESHLKDINSEINSLAQERERIISAIDNSIASHKEMDERSDRLEREVERYRGIYDSISSQLEGYSDSDMSNHDEYDIDDLYKKKIKSQSMEEDVARYHSKIQEMDEKISQEKENLQWYSRRVRQIENLKFQTSPNGDLSSEISLLMKKIGKKSTELYNSLFSSSSVISILDGEEDGEKTCIVTFDERDVATYSHGEQLRIYGCIQAAFTCSVYSRTSMWIPMMWDEPSLATDSDVVEKIFSLPSMVTPKHHQSFIITRDASVDATGDKVISLSG